VALDPTLVSLRKIVDWAVEPEALNELAALQEPALGRDWVSTASWFVSGWTREDTAAAVAALEIIGEIVAKFVRLGGRLVVGTDQPFAFVVPGLSMHQEMQVLVEAGLSCGQVLRAATGVAATALGWSSEVGFIRSGNLADLVVCEGDPLSNISDSVNIEAVYKGGELVYRAESLKGLGSVFDSASL
jgi:predicted amidohydrolase YtcJ